MHGFQGGGLRNQWFPQFFFQVAAAQCSPTCYSNAPLWEIEFLWFLWYLYISLALISNLPDEDPPLPNHHTSSTIWHQHFDLQVIKWTCLIKRLLFDFFHSQRKIHESYSCMPPILRHTCVCHRYLWHTQYAPVEWVCQKHLRQTQVCRNIGGIHEYDSCIFLWEWKKSNNNLLISPVFEFTWKNLLFLPWKIYFSNCKTLFLMVLEVSALLFRIEELFLCFQKLIGKLHTFYFGRFPSLGIELGSLEWST